MRQKNGLNTICSSKIKNKLKKFKKVLTQFGDFDILENVTAIQSLLANKKFKKSSKNMLTKLL